MMSQAKPQVDKRAILAVIEAVAYTKEPTLITKYENVKLNLFLATNIGYEYRKVEEELYNALVNKRLKHIYLIYKDGEDRNFDIVLISPIELSEEQLRALSEEAAVFGNHFSYTMLDEHIKLITEAEDTINHAVTWLAKKNSVAEALADAVTALAREYGLDFKDVRGVYAMFCLNYGICQGGET
jgi:hypothetical protein